MKHRFLVIILAVCILLCAVPLTGAQAAGSLCFIACNESLLTLDSMPYFSGSATYVPYWALSSFGMYYSYFDSSNAASVFTADKQIFFDLDTGDSFDSAENRYSAAAVSRGGAIYVPLDFICSYFGLTWSYITGTGYGDIVRIKNSAVALTDSQFLSAASELMQQRYNAYYGIVEATPAPTPLVVDRSETTVYLSFSGLPDDDVLDVLGEHSMKGCFFLTAEDIASAPNLVRRLAGEGHTLGLLCASDPESGFRRAGELLYEAAHVRTILAAASADEAACAAYASKNGLVFCSADITGANAEGQALTANELTQLIYASTGRADLRLDCGGDTAKTLEQIFIYLTANKFTVGLITESFVNAEAAND